jgi:hypothetical protein
MKVKKVETEDLPRRLDTHLLPGDGERVVGGCDGWLGKGALGIR